jgi:hypothetical protein
VNRLRVVEDLSTILSLLSDAGFEPVWVDLTHPEFDVPVGRSRRGAGALE